MVVLEQVVLHGLAHTLGCRLLVTATRAYAFAVTTPETEARAAVRAEADHEAADALGDQELILHDAIGGNSNGEQGMVFTYLGLGHGPVSLW